MEVNIRFNKIAILLAIRRQKYANPRQFLTTAATRRIRIQTSDVGWTARDLRTTSAKDRSRRGTLVELEESVDCSPTNSPRYDESRTCPS